MKQDIEDIVGSEPNEGQADLATATDMTLQEFLVFRLGSEEYGLPILSVQELRGHERATVIANAPDFIKGMINLRGVIIPVVDIRVRFNPERPVDNASAVTIILNLGRSTIGMLVDGVADVVILSAEKIKPAPAMGTAVDTGYLTGLGTIDERMIMLVDIEKLMAGIGVRPLANAA